MGKKKSLGHNPLAYSTLGHASFDFIPSTENEKKEAFKNAAEETDEDKISKMTASYYLEESLIERIKILANKQETTYSSIVSRLLKNGLKNLSED